MMETTNIIFIGIAVIVVFLILRAVVGRVMSRKKHPGVTEGDGTAVTDEREIAAAVASIAHGLSGASGASESGSSAEVAVAILAAAGRQRGTFTAKAAGTMEEITAAITAVKILHQTTRG